MYVSLCVCVLACMYACVCAHMFVHTCNESRCVCVCACVYFDASMTLPSDCLVFSTHEKQYVIPLLTHPLSPPHRVDMSANAPSSNPHPTKSPLVTTPATKMSPVNARRSNGLNGAKVKFIDAKGPFADHCVEFETAHRVRSPGLWLYICLCMSACVCA